MPDLKQLKNTLHNVLRSFPEVEAAFLFGSVAEGRAREGSDIDLALVPADNLLKERKLELLAAMTEAGLDNLDLVILDIEDPVLRYEAIRQNCLVYAREGFDRGGYYSRGMREYFDIEPILAVQREAYKKRLERGQT
ncbi:MAG: nucleotidyltransferase domain-containing protein [Gammaproteobacteria bacterium]|nr:nucleotidyltransferase domain-containing protein [Gammaproteobacteria bacterium]